MGICPHHCPPEHGGGLLTVVVVAAGAVLGVAVLRAAASIAEAAALVILGVGAVSTPVVVCLVVRGRVRPARNVLLNSAQHPPVTLEARNYEISAMGLRSVRDPMRKTLLGNVDERRHASVPCLLEGRQVVPGEIIASKATVRRR